MVISETLRKPFVISLIGHLALFSVFSFSFGRKLPAAGYTQGAFWGAFLDQRALIPRFTPLPSNNQARLPLSSSTFFTSLPTERIAIAKQYLKPTFQASPAQEKMQVVCRLAIAPPPQNRKTSTIMFYPELPYHFLLYFKDRQTAHIELMFKADASGRSNAVEVRRKISSGNLEADLLSLRYVSHYLFVQRAPLATDEWQTVKIDLSAKEPRKDNVP